eukprot:8095346-Pyramimonas_sp.AAC.1
MGAVSGDCQRSRASTGSRAGRSATRGPIGATILSLQRVNWHLENPFELETSEGLLIQLTTVPPALLKYHLEEARGANLEKRAAAKMGMPQEKVRRLGCEAGVRG